MAIDAYSPCPGGTGKKIKFCCGGDFLPELQKIDRMIDGEQYLACLQHIDHLMAHEPGRDRRRGREVVLHGDRPALDWFQLALFKELPGTEVIVPEPGRVVSLD